MKKQSIIIKCFACILLITLNIPSFSQSLKGNWYGKLDMNGTILRLVFHIDSTIDGYSVFCDSPDQNSFNIPITIVNYHSPKIYLNQKIYNFAYEGFVNKDFNYISGTFKQGSFKSYLELGRDSIPADESSPVSIKKKYQKKEIYITMRDGKKLFTSIYSPINNSNKNPILFIRTPYNIEPQEKEFNWYLSAYHRFVKENYILVFQDVRGKFMSEGKYEDIRPYILEKKDKNTVDEASDTYDTIDWLVKNVKNNNGNVGVMGISYPGFYSTMAILSRHPALKAVSPQAPVTAWFIGDDFHHNGAFFLMDCFSFFYATGKTNGSMSRSGFRGFNWPTQDSYTFFLNEGTVKELKSKYFADSIEFMNNAFNHPNYDEFWKARDPRQYLTNVKPAVMTVGGWFDAEDLYGTLHTYQAIEKQNPITTNNYIIVGPWEHGQWGSGRANNVGNIYWGEDANKHFQEYEVKFFDYYLRGIGTGNFSEASIFITGRNKWETFNEWPPINTTDQNMFFKESGKLDFSVTQIDESFDEYISDPSKPVPYYDKIHKNRDAAYMTADQRIASHRPDVLVYQTNILQKNITVTGPILADLYVATTGTDADLIVKLIDVFPEDTVATYGEDIQVPLGGYQMLVRGEVFRGKFRNSFEKPEAFVPNNVYEIKYELPDIAHTFKKGHRIMIQVQSSWFPLVDINPQKFIDIYNCSRSDFQKATIRLYHDTKRPSSLKVKILNE